MKIFPQNRAEFALDPSLVHRVTPEHISQRKTMCRLLDENYLAGEKRKYIVAVHES